MLVIAGQMSAKHGLQDPKFAFNDAHMLMSYLGANDNQKRDEFVHSMKEYISLILFCFIIIQS